MGKQSRLVKTIIHRVREAPLLRATLLGATLLAGSVLVGSGSAAFAASCEGLLTATLPNVTITSATSVAAGTYQPPGSATAFTKLPAFCRVTATISPVPDSLIQIEVWLPATTWNGRYQQVGNHGWGSGIYESEMAPQLRRGFATAATDDGHPGSPANAFDVSWAYGHPAKLEDFATRAVHQLAENAKLLIAAFYGKPQSAAYFNGCSDGGREGLEEAHAFPADFNGILIGGVASGWTHAMTEQLVATINLANSGIHGARGTAILTLAQNAATRACDGIDGVADGLIGNPKLCHWSPYTLVCKPGQVSDACITTAQADALQANHDPLRDPVTGKWVFSGQSPGSEFNQIKFGFDLALSGFPLAGYQLAFNDPGWDGSTFDLHADLPVLDQALGFFNVTDPDLRPFAAAGGKLIQWHGWDDAAFTPGWITKYYEEVVARMGNGNVKNVEDFYRLFMLPGVGHCGAPGAGSTDVGPDDIGAENQPAVSSDPAHDAVTALMDWTEHNVAPKYFVATKFVNNDPARTIQMQRPICPYPAKPIWNGVGNTNVATSFYCSGPFGRN